MISKNIGRRNLVMGISVKNYTLPSLKVHIFCIFNLGFSDRRKVHSQENP